VSGRREQEASGSPNHRNAQGTNGVDAPAAPPALADPAEPSEEPGWLVVSLGTLAAAMAMVAVLAARRAIRTAQPRQAT
jgi:hypothetical protein